MLAARHLLWFFTALLVSLGDASAVEPRVNEFMADNKSGLSDADGDEVDWVEIYNPNPVALDLTGWYLTDDLAALTKWSFPVASINANGYLVVFASGKNRRTPGAELHTNFSLKADGEALALVKPDGVTVVSQFVFGPQVKDTSFGLSAVVSATETLVPAGAAAQALIPSNDSLGTSWTQASFTPIGWLTGNLPVGYENGTGYESLISLDVKTPMNGLQTSCFIRVPFTLSSLTDLSALTLRMRYDDGFAVYLNGTLLTVAGRNEPALLPFNANADRDHDDAEAVVFEDIDLSQHVSLLTAGNNVLAIHGLNSSSTSSDFLIGPELRLTRATFSNGFMTTPSPGAVNLAAVQGFVKDTSFSMARGFHSAPFDLTITTETPDAVIRYTRNGSTPTATTGFVYASPLTLSETSIIRAAAFKEGFQASNVDTQTYLFLDDVINQSANEAAPAGWPSSPVNGQIFNYGMDPDVVTPRAATIKAALQSIPTMSVVTDLPNLFDPSTGIYVNTTQRGDAWERPMSLEIINDPLNPNPKGHQENGSLRLRGGFSRDGNNPKHSFRFFFSKAYGAGKLSYKLFGDDGASEFDGFDMRTSQDASWAYLGSAQNTFLRDEVSRDTQVRVSVGSRCRYFHLYLNGQYWGLYNTDERPNSKYGAQYLGGTADEYDTVKSASAIGGYQTEASDGSMAVGSAWEKLWNGARTVRTSPSNANYFKLMGRAANGITPTADPPVLDAVNLADYLMVLFYMGGNDGPVSEYVGASNNWFGLRRRGGESGFRFFIHDFEQSLGLEETTNQRVGKGATVAPWSNTVAGKDLLERSNPEFIHEDLARNLEYRTLFGDRAHRLLFNNGLLTDTAVLDRMNAFAAIIDTAIWAESARWGDAQRSDPFVRDDWLSANEFLFNFIRYGTYAATSGPGRAATVLAQLRGYDGGTKPLYPLTNAPVFSKHGGPIPAGVTSLTMSQSNTGSAVIYYTVNGADPRVVGGGVHASALVYSAAVSLNAWTTTVRARVKKGTSWSALNEAVFVRSSALPPLRVSEIMAAPASPSAADVTAGFTDKDDFEFIELLNDGTDAVNVRDMRFSQGVELVFADAVLAANERGVIVRNRAAFQRRYGTTARVLGVYVGSLEDNGERLVLLSADGRAILDFSYEGDFPWPVAVAGSSLTLRRGSADPASAASWRLSLALNGSPGTNDGSRYASWKTMNQVSNDNTDTDRDGVSPLAEYAMGGLPTSNESALQPQVITQTVLTDTSALISFRWHRSADDVLPVIEQSLDLQSWTAPVAELTSTQPVAAGIDLVTWKVPASLPGHVYYRVRWTTLP
jgi:Lamin Tail Domain/CotH kinase protein/Chitobiase/beta-hexosaminidase C-terminal domain